MKRKEFIEDEVKKKMEELCLVLFVDVDEASILEIPVFDCDSTVRLVFWYTWTF